MVQLTSLTSLSINQETITNMLLIFLSRPIHVETQSLFVDFWQSLYLPIEKSKYQIPTSGMECNCHCSIINCKEFLSQSFPLLLSADVAISRVGTRFGYIRHVCTFPPCPSRVVVSFCRLYYDDSVDLGPPVAPHEISSYSP